MIQTSLIYTWTRKTESVIVNMKKIEADLKYYNANSRDVHTGDCVKRSLSVAYSLDYDAVSAELNRIKRSTGHSAYNISPVFEAFMKRRGDTFTKVTEDITVDEFSKTHSSGVYIILCGEKAASVSGPHSSHMAAIVNGDVYDSWNSLNYYVKSYAKVTAGKTDQYEFDSESICKTVAAAVSDYATNNVQRKLPEEMSVHVASSIDRNDRYTWELLVRCKLGEMSVYCTYPSNITLSHIIVMKTNPRLSEEENIQSLTKKTKQKLYDWVYNIKDIVISAKKLETLPLHKYFHTNVDDTIITKMPSWAVPYITRIYDNGEGYDYGERYEVEMDPLPDDPRVKDKEENKYGTFNVVDFRADTLRELKRDMEWYKSDYARLDYDY